MADSCSQIDLLVACCLCAVLSVTDYFLSLLHVNIVAAAVVVGSCM